MQAPHGMRDVCALLARACSIAMDQTKHPSVSALRTRTMQARQAQKVAQESGTTLEDAALDRLAVEVEAGKADGEQWGADTVETTETKAFIDGLKADERALAEDVKQVHSVHIISVRRVHRVAGAGVLHFV